MENPDSTIDELGAEIRDLRDAIRKKRKELQELRSRMITLQRYRAMLVHHRYNVVDTDTPGVTANLPLVMEEGPPYIAPTTLREAATRLLEERGATGPETALRVSDLIQELEPWRGAVDHRSFYTMVYVALLRASQQKKKRWGHEVDPEVGFVKETGGRRFYRNK